MRTCTSCGITEDIIGFHPRHGICKQCYRENCRDYYERNRAMFVAKGNDWKKKFPEKYNAHRRKKRLFA